MENALSILHEKYFGHGNGEKALQKNVMSKRHFRKMLCRHICTFAHLGKCHVVTFAHLHIWENEQQSVRLVISYRGKNEKSSFLSLCLSFENYFLYLYQYLYFCFWRGEQSQKKTLRFWMVFWRGKTKTVRLIEIQSGPASIKTRVRYNNFSVLQMLWIIRMGRFLAKGTVGCNIFLQVIH